MNQVWYEYVLLSKYFNPFYNKYYLVEITHCYKLFKVQSYLQFRHWKLAIKLHIPNYENQTAHFKCQTKIGRVISPCSIRQHNKSETNLASRLLADTPALVKADNPPAEDHHKLTSLVTTTEPQLIPSIVPHSQGYYSWITAKELLQQANKTENHQCNHLIFFYLILGFNMRLRHRTQRNIKPRTLCQGISKVLDSCHGLEKKRKKNLEQRIQNTHETSASKGHFTLYCIKLFTHNYCIQLNRRKETRLTCTTTKFFTKCRQN